MDKDMRNVSIVSISLIHFNRSSVYVTSSCHIGAGHSTGSLDKPEHPVFSRYGVSSITSIVIGAIQLGATVIRNTFHQPVQGEHRIIGTGSRQ